jgi:DNA-directed RNA polymerase subunit N (RpoN/RPB10)
MSCAAPLFPVCCYTCRKVINPQYHEFRRRVWDIQAMNDDELEYGITKKDMVAGALSELGIHRLCCRIIFISYVDNFVDELVQKGDQFKVEVHARSPGEASGTVKIIRGPVDNEGNPAARAKPTSLLAR